MSETTKLEIVEAEHDEYRDPLLDVRLPTPETDPIGFRSVVQSEGEPIVRHRSQVERSLALLVEAWALVDEASYYESGSYRCTTAGVVAAEQASAGESLGNAAREIGYILHQDGDLVVVGYERDPARAQDQRRDNRELLERDAPAARPAHPYTAATI